MRYRIKLEWENENGNVETAELGHVEAGACESAADVGVKLVAAKEIVGRLQEIVITHQLQRHCDAARPCPVCHVDRSIKDYRTRTLDTVLGQVIVKSSRFNRCRTCGQKSTSSPLTDLLPDRSLPELHHLQAKLAAELPYRRATELLRELLPQTGGLTPVTTRNRNAKDRQRDRDRIVPRDG